MEVHSIGYLSSNEAIWRIFEFPIHEYYPAIIRLNVHLENQVWIYFNELNIIDRISTPKLTQLTAFFILCQEDGFARTLIFEEIPIYYIFSSNKWNKRKIGLIVKGQDNIRKSEVIGRVYIVHLTADPERFYLRMLLMNIKGRTSFHAFPEDYMKTIYNGKK